MATKIILKKSTTGGSAPVAGNIDVGELAVNLADRKIYAKDGANNIVTLNGAYVDSTAPGNAVEGDLWYDTANNMLKTHNGSSFVSAGYTSLTEFGVTASSAELNKLDGATVTTAEINILDGLTATTTELNYVDGVTSSIQTQLDGKQPSGAYLTAESDTLATVTGRGATTGTAVSITNATSSSSTTTGAFKVTGGVGIGENLHVGGDTVISGNLTVDGTTTAVNSNEVNIGDAIILLNADETGTPSQNGGIEVERGTAANKSFVWNEADDAWDLSNETLQNVTINGGTY